MKPKSKLLSLLLTICLVVGLMPTAAFAAGTDTGKAIQLVDSGTAANIGGGQQTTFILAPISRAATEAAAITPTRSSGGCWRMQTGSCSCFPTKIWTYFNIIQIMRA